MAYYNAAMKVGVERITEDVIVGSSGDSDDSEEFDFEEDDAEDRSSKPSHIHFGRSTIMKGHIEVFENTNYISDTSIVRYLRTPTTLLPEENKVIVFRSFVKSGLQFLLHKLVIEVLKNFDVYLHQLT